MIEQSSSQGQVTTAARAERISSTMRDLGYQGKDITSYLKELIDDFSHAPGLAWMGVGYRDRDYAPPVLDFEAFWATPIRLELMPEVNYISALHDKFSLAVDPDIDSSLSLGDAPEKSQQKEFQDRKQSWVKRYTIGTPIDFFDVGRLCSVQTGEDFVVDGLNDWLRRNGLPKNRAVFASEALRSFYYREMLRFDEEQVEIGVTATLDEYHQHDVELHFLYPGTNTKEEALMQSIRQTELGRTFATLLAIPVLPNPHFRESYYSRDRLSQPTFLEQVTEDAKHTQRHFLGVITPQLHRFF